MRKIVGEEYTYILNGSYYVTIAFIGNHDLGGKIFDKALELGKKFIEANEYILVCETTSEIDFKNIWLDTRDIRKIETYHLEPKTEMDQLLFRNYKTESLENPPLTPASMLTRIEFEKYYKK